MTMATNATSNVYSTGFADPNFLDSNQHSAKTDAYGIGISLLVALTGEPANGLRTRWEDTLADLAEGGGGSEELRQHARRVACWPESVTVALARVVHGLSVARKSHRQPLRPCLGCRPR